jgi:hypothetical protein
VVDEDLLPDVGSGSHDEILWSADAMPPHVDARPLDARSLGATSVPQQRSATDPDAPQRVRVVLAERKGVARPVRTLHNIQEATTVGALLRSDLIDSQLAVALRFAAGAGLPLALTPLLFALFPAVGEFELLGLRLPWLLLGVLVYPFLLGLGWWHTRTAERVEQTFADHVQE